MFEYRTSVSAEYKSSVGGAIERRAGIFAAVADPTRLGILELLDERREMSGSELAQALGISLALYSHHSKTLVEVDLVRRRKRGQTG